MSEGSYDAVIIGSGPNGLAAAIRLAQRGWRTLVVEGSDTIGGGTRTKELTLPGFNHDVCSAVHPMGIASPYFRTLDLESHGLKWLQPKVPLAHPLDGGRAAALFPSMEETCANLGADGGRYRLFFKQLSEHADQLFETLLKPLSLPAHPLLMMRFGMGAGLPATIFSKYFRTEEARALFGGNAAHAVMALDLLLTSAIGLTLQVAAHGRGWPIPQGGSQSIAEALASKLRSLGGEIQTGRSIQSLGDLPKAKAYLFDISPANLAKICSEALPANYRKKLMRYRHGPGVFKMDYALSAPIPWSHEWCRQAGTVHVGGTFEEIAAGERLIWEGKHADKPFVLVSQPTLQDSSRAPEGKHVAWAYCHVPNGSNQDCRAIIENQIERFAPGFKDTILGAHAMASMAFEAYNPNYIGGDVVGGVTDWRQLFSRPVRLFQPYTTPNPLIYICSASSPPGGGVHGMCGYWAAEAVMKRHQPGS